MVLAQRLVALAHEHDAVPSLSPKLSVKLGAKPMLFFSGVPDFVRDLVMEESVRILSDELDNPVVAGRDRVVPEPFAEAYRHICHEAGELCPELVRVTWAVIGKSFSSEDVLAAKPWILSKLADELPEHHRVKVVEWLASCRLAAVDGGGKNIIVGLEEALPNGVEGIRYLPRRLLKLLDEGYSEPAVTLLVEAGLASRPSHQLLSTWITDHLLNASECQDLLRYFFESERFKDQDYRHLNTGLKSPWFPHKGKFLTVRNAVAEGLLDHECLGDLEFQAWLGLFSVEEPEIDELADPEIALGLLYEWWKQNGDEWTRKYEKRTYPLGRPPKLGPEFYDTTSERRQWLTLFLIASLHTMGRARPEQHRNFIEMCEHRGWMEIFCDSQSTAEAWMSVLVQYLDHQVEEAAYYQWMMHFVRIFQLSRWLGVYTNQFLSINKRQKFSLARILRPAADPALSGSGESAPPIPLGMGGCFVVRELTRQNVLLQSSAHRYCFVPVRRVRSILKAMGCELDENVGIESSPQIYDFISQHIGKEKANFAGSFDLPLMALAEDSDLQALIFGKDFNLDSFNQ